MSNTFHLLSEGYIFKVIAGVLHDICRYFRSTLVRDILVECHNSSKKIRVVVVDSRPHYEGKEVFKFLSSRGISCTYVLINAISYVMTEVSG